jgi:hypothetical protein
MLVVENGQGPRDHAKAWHDEGTLGKVTAGERIWPDLSLKIVFESRVAIFEWHSFEYGDS